MTQQLSKQQACQLLIEQEIEQGLAEGESKYAIGKEISSWVAKLFDARIKPNTISKRAQRISNQGLGTNVPSPAPTSQAELTEEPEWQEPPIKSGEPSREPENVNFETGEVDSGEIRVEKDFISSGMAGIFKELEREIRKAKKDRWRSTSRNAAFHHLQILETIVMSR